MNLKYLATIVVLLLLSSSCRESAALNPNGVPQGPVPDSTQQTLETSKDVKSYLTKEASLTYQDFRVSKERKTIGVEGIETEVSYAVLKKDQRVMAVFDGLHHPAGNTTAFGLFPFLGGEPKQLVVEQAIPRNWRHWIMTLSTEVHMIFDSGDYGVDGDLILIDVNNDGVFEFSKTVIVFYGFENLPSSDSPIIDVLFKYDETAMKYVPANDIFQDHALKGIEDEKRNVHSNNDKEYLSNVLHILLRYVYAGNEQAGWSFYDNEYKLPNKDKIKTEVVAKLVKEPVYRFIYRKPNIAKQKGVGP